MRNSMCQLLPARPLFWSFSFFCVHAQRPPTAVSRTLFVLTNEGSKLMWKDVLIIIHLPSNYTQGCWLSITLCFSLSLSRSLSISIARLPAGATRLAGREVTTRGQPHVSVSHVKSEKGGQLAASSLFVLLFPYISRTDCNELCSNQICFIVSF